ncbi:hypothetical protein L7F22_031109 [Adiantum nelumboides]|nr:hypothetical protein [Adiantum nelumboides]
MVKKAKWVTGFGYLSSKGLYAAGMLFLMRQGCFTASCSNNKRSHADHCLYTKRDEDGSPIILVLYVDDMLIAAKKSSTVDALKEQLKSAFSMKYLGESEHILGVRVTRQRDQHTLYLSQEKYIEKVLARFNMAEAKPLGVPLQPYVKISKDDCPKVRKKTTTYKVCLVLQLVVHYPQVVTCLLLQEVLFHGVLDCKR